MDRFRRLMGDRADLVRDVIVEQVRRCYDINAERFDPSVGDDGFTFGSLMWRNSWHLLDRAFGRLEGARTDWPAGSFLVDLGVVTIKFYSCGHDENVEVASMRFDDGSVTKASIARANQLVIDFGAAGEDPLDDLRQLVVVHAGNPDDGCCGVWIGAPRLTSPESWDSWAWVEPLWKIGRAVASVAEPIAHTDLEEAHFEVELLATDASDDVDLLAADASDDVEPIEEPSLDLHLREEERDEKDL